MSWIGELLANVHNWKNGTWKIKQSLELSPSPLRIGVLGAAAIAYGAIIDPIETHPGVILAGIAARDKSRAEALIAKHPQTNLNRPAPKAYGSYEELLADADIDAVYIPLPNGVHCEWAVKALEAGKHVLIEKPVGNNAAEVERIADAAKKAGKVALEAYHWRFHPAAHRVKAIIESGKYGRVTGIDAKMTLFGGGLAKDDIRFKYELGGGSTMDFCYTISACLYFAGMGGDNIRVLQAKPRLHTVDKKIDEAMDATFVVDPPAGVERPPVTCQVYNDSSIPHLFGFIPRVWDTVIVVTVELEKAKIKFDSFVIPTYGHSIVVQEKGKDGKVTGAKATEKRFKAESGEQWPEEVGEKWWTTYRYQLEAFVEAVRAKEKDEEWKGPWVDLGESADVLHAIDSVYEKAGLPKRGL